jgi:hypothetical protein
MLYETSTVNTWQSEVATTYVDGVEPDTLLGRVQLHSISETHLS